MFGIAVTTAVLLSASAPMKLASPGWSYINVDDKKGDFFADYFAQQLAVRGFSVTTKSEISSLIGFERQKQLMGCSTDSTNCIAELAGALGVDALITGSLAKFRAGYTVTVKVVAAGTGQQIAVDSGKLKDDDDLVEWLQEAAERMAPKLSKPTVAETPEEPPRVEDKPVSPETPVVAPQAAVTIAEPSSPSRVLRPVVLIPAVTGALFIAGGAFAYAQSQSIHAELLRGTQSEYVVPGDFEASNARAEAAAKAGAIRQTVGLVGVSVGAAALATAAMMALRVDPNATVAAVVTPSSAGIGLGGSF